MKLDHIPLDHLKLSPINVRKKGGIEHADLLPSIRRLGILQPLLVRPNCDGFEIVAGQRRFHALTTLAGEGIAEPVPCIIMEEGDNALAIEASLAENAARLPMDEIDQYKAFQSLVGEGLDVLEIAARFGVTERLVNQRLAIAGIIEPILNAYRREEIEPETLRILTMATPRQQREWWKLFKSDDEYAPEGRNLRAWLFGGRDIPLANAIFDTAEYKGAIISDLFGENRYFADAQSFWPLQHAAIAAKKESCLADGWKEVVILDIGQHFPDWQYQKVSKKKGGAVFISITADGEVTVHEGLLSRKEAGRKEKEEEGAATPKPARPETTAPMRNYLGLHKHAAVRTELLSHPGIAQRLIVLHMITGSGLWTVRAEGQRADTKEIGASLAAAKATSVFADERRVIGELLGVDASDDEAGSIAMGTHYPQMRMASRIFEKLIALDDASVTRIMTFVMAETLQAEPRTTDVLGTLLQIDLRRWWSPDETFLALMRDKEALNAMVREVAGDGPADAHTAATAKVQKKIIADCLDGTREPVTKDWLPAYMEFPARGYTGRFAGSAFEADPADEADEG